MDVSVLRAAIAEARRERGMLIEKLRECDALHFKAEMLSKFIDTGELIVNGTSSIEPAALDQWVHSSATPLPRSVNETDEVLWKVIQMILQLHKRPMSAGEILTFVENESFEIQGVHRCQTICNAVIRKQDIFECVGEELFAIRDWLDDVKHSRPAMHPALKSKG